MILARCRDGADAGASPFWAAVDQAAGTARPLEGPFAHWAPGLTQDPTADPAWAGPSLPLDDLRLLAPLERTAKIVCAGANYRKHVADIGLKMPERPAVFLKPWDAIIGPDDAIASPLVTEELDYEVELVAIVGAASANGSPEDGVLGYTVGNDVSARDLQMNGGVTGMDMFSGKGLDGTTGLGPWIVTRDEFPALPDLELHLSIDGETRQRDRTSSMVWNVGELMSFVNARSRLNCGDVLFTGTPAGVGLETRRFLRPGQEVEASIEGIGTLRNVVAARG